LLALRALKTRNYPVQAATTEAQGSVNTFQEYHGCLARTTETEALDERNEWTGPGFRVAQAGGEFVANVA
jgi:hypothetical protein